MSRTGPIFALFLASALAARTTPGGVVVDRVACAGRPGRSYALYFPGAGPIGNRPAG